MKQRNLLSSLFLILAAPVGFYSCESPGEDFDPAVQFEKDVKAIDNFLMGQGLQAFKDASGIRFRIIELGTGGLPPKRSQTAKIKVTTKLLDGTIVESEKTIETGLINFPTIGLVEGVEVMPVGTKATLYVPSGLAYGNFGVGIIPPNTNLLYEVELEAVTLPTSEQQQLASDSVAIDAYLSDNSIVAEKGPLGIRYVVQQQGAGAYPYWYSQLKITYTGKLMSTNVQFFTGTLQPTDIFNSRVVDYLHGLQVAFQILPSGSKATFYIPSTLGFGPGGAGDGQVPANANLIYEISSLQIVN